MAIAIKGSFILVRKRKWKGHCFQMRIQFNVYTEQRQRSKKTIRLRLRSVQVNLNTRILECEQLVNQNANHNISQKQVFKDTWGLFRTRPSLSALEPPGNVPSGPSASPALVSTSPPSPLSYEPPQPPSFAILFRPKKSIQKLTNVQLTLRSCSQVAKFTELLIFPLI